MWTYNTDYKKWFANEDSISKSDFDLLKQELRATRYYSRILSGATYLPVNNLTDIYDILGDYQARDWYISTDTTIGSPYSITSIPSQNATSIDDNNYDDYSKYLTEYGLTLKNLFTPYRLIKDASKNFYYVDVATTQTIDLLKITKNYVIDGVILTEGHRVLIKDQLVNVVLLSSEDPNTYFTSKYTVVEDLGATIEYQYSSEENGIYKYSNGNLIRENDLDVYDQCVRYSVSVKLGAVNSNKQFHLSRLLSGYYPTTLLEQPIEFTERHNWILRNRVDYNNLFEINYYDIIKHGDQIYNYQGFTYSIPERTIAVGEFGVILNTQEGKSNIIKNKYKVNLRGISETVQHYWICGDENTLLRVRKHDFFIDRILLEEIPTTLPQLIITNLNSVSFFNDIIGVVVGELNTILYTKDSGETWNRIEVDSFSEYNYNKVLYSTNSSFYVAGKSGVLIEFVDSILGWTAYERRISQIEDSVDEYLLVENINDIYKTSISTWGVSYSYYTQSIPTNKELLFLVTNNSKIIAYDINASFSQIGTDFIYFDFGQDYKDIRNIIRKQDTNTFYFTGTDPVTDNDGIFSFDINNFGIIGTGSSYSNTAIGTNATFEYSGYTNKIFDYNSNEMLICGNTSLLGYSTYSTIILNSLDSTFEDKLKSKMLVIDYDIASKLNFFTDDGDYRLPNSITFSNDKLSTVNSKIGFNPIQHNQTTINGGTYSETNWLTYWTDTQKTFEYYTNMPLDESTKVLISTTFSYDSNAVEFIHTSDQVTGSASQIAYLAPSILYDTHSRYFNQGTSITAPTSLTAVIFLYDYLMVYKVNNNYPVSVGDVLKIESDIVDTELIVNKIVLISGFKYLYMATDFNQNIINDIQLTSGDIKIKNLNKYITNADLKDKFNTHPISNAYKLDYVDLNGNVTIATSSFFQLSARFNNLTSYYNLQTSVTVATNTQIFPFISDYNFSGGVSYSILTTGMTYSFSGGISASTALSPLVGSSGIGGFIGDTGPALLARLDGPVGISYDSIGNLYIADNLNNRIRKVTSGIIDTIAGSSSTPGLYSGDGGLAVDAGLENPIDVTVDMLGNVYIVGGTGSTNQVIRKIDSGAGIIDIYAGTPPGIPGYNSAGENAPIFDPAVQFDNITGIHYSMIGLGFGGPFGGECLYVVDCNNHLIRQIDITTGIIRTVAGDMTLTPGYGGDGGLATSAQLTNPYSVTTDTMGNLYIADSGNFVVRKVDISTGEISTVAGIGVNGYTGDGGFAINATLGTVTDIAIDIDNNLHISSDDGVNKTIRVVDGFGKISTLTVLPSQAFKLATSPIVPGIILSLKDNDVVLRHPLPETAAINSSILTFLPVNNDIILLKLNGISTTFTFKTVPTLLTDVLIDSTINGCLNNLKTKIESSSAYSTYLVYAQVIVDTLILTVKNGYGSIPNNNSNWNISFFNTTIVNEVNAILSGSMSALPMDGNTTVLSINSNVTTYTFKDTPALIDPTQIQIGSTIGDTLANLLKGVTSSYPTYISPTSSVVSGDVIKLYIKSGFGSIPNSNSNWKLTYNLTVGGDFISTDYDMIYNSVFLKFGYSPTYNLMDYLTGLNNLNDVNPKFYATKEYVAMPKYEGLPLGSLTFSTVYIDYNGLTYSGGSMSLPTNKILFGTGLKLEWDSIFINTFVDVRVSGDYNYFTEKLLVMNKYYDSLQNAYVIEFHKRVLPISSLFQNILSGCTLDIFSRRSLSQISDDLQELNMIQRTKNKSNSWLDQDLFKYDNYQNELNFKIPTDSYAKILLSDSDTIQALSAIIYIDYKNELSMNITRLAKEYNIPILNTINFTNKLYISCSEKHYLLDGDGVVLEFNGGVGSSQELNPQYFGYHVITKINDYDFVTDIAYGTTPTTGEDTGYVKYTKEDAFLNYQPVDLIDLGFDGKGKMALELSIENLKLLNNVYSLVNVDFDKYRFRLVDGLNMDIINSQYAWLLEAELSGAVIGLSNDELVWYKGTWLYGRWFGGIWQSGVWMAGDWYGGTWNSNTISDKILTVDVDTKTVDFEQSFWYNGRWFSGTWNAGIWYNGRWYDGNWNNGVWYNGIWNDGVWNNGRFEGGVWVLGTWNNGVFNCDNEPSYWLDGEWLGGDFENGMWYNGTWEQRNSLSRFGTKSFNSRTANWQSGKWLSGSFYSYLNTDNGVLIASEVNKYSIWKTGQWFSGEWYGGVAYNMDFKTGTWYGGILEDIQVIQIDTVDNTFTLNGIFYFNTGDNIYIIDNLLNNSNSVFGSDENPGSYIVLYATQDISNQSTTIYVADNLIGTSISSSVDTGLRVVSKFTNLNWKGGIWTNGIYESGIWEGGIWYNGIFNGIWL